MSCVGKRRRETAAFAGQKKAKVLKIQLGASCQSDPKKNDLIKYNIKL